MKYGNQEISDMGHWELAEAYNKIVNAEAERNEASKHDKFNNGSKKMEFPPINPEFVKLKNEIEKELKKRGYLK